MQFVFAGIDMNRLHRTISKWTGAPLLLLVLFTGTASSAAEKGEMKREADRLSRQYLQVDEYQTVLADNPTLEEYLAYGETHNPGLRAAYYVWTSRLEAVGRVSALPDPVLNFGYFGEEVQTRVGPQERRVGIRQKIPWPGTLGLRGAAMFDASQAAFQKYEAARLRLHYDIRRAYYEYYLLGREIRIMQENMELLKYWESVARIKYQAGLSKHPDVIKAQVELGKLDDRLATLEHKRGPVVAKLRAALDLPESTDLPEPIEISDVYRPLDGHGVRVQVVAGNPNLKSLDHLEDRQKAFERLASKASLPNFTFGFDYIETGEALMPDVDGSGANPWMVSVGINLPLWFGKNSARRKEAAAGRQSARYRRLDAANRLIAAVDRILFEYEDANRKVRLYKNGLIPKGTEQLEAAYAAYQTGQSDFLNLIDAQRQLLSFQLEYERGLTARATRFSELQMLTNNEEL